MQARRICRAPDLHVHCLSILKVSAQKQHGKATSLSQQESSSVLRCHFYTDADLVFVSATSACPYYWLARRANASQRTEMRPQVRATTRCLRNELYSSSFVGPLICRVKQKGMHIVGGKGQPEDGVGRMRDHSWQRTSTQMSAHLDKIQSEDEHRPGLDVRAALCGSGWANVHARQSQYLGFLTGSSGMHAHESV